MRTAKVVTLALCALLLAGCGHDAALTSDASSRLRADVARLRTAATSGTSAQVAAAADALRAHVAAEQARGGLSAERATAVLDQLARVLADTAARPAPRPTVAPPAPPVEHHHRKKKGDKGGGEHD